MGAGGGGGGGVTEVFGTTPIEKIMFWKVHLLLNWHGVLVRGGRDYRSFCIFGDCGDLVCYYSLGVCPGNSQRRLTSPNLEKCSNVTGLAKPQPHILPLLQINSDTREANKIWLQRLNMIIMAVLIK